MRRARLRLLLVAAMIACGTEDPDAGLRADVRDLQVRTVPADARLVSDAGIHRDSYSVGASWEVEAATSWDDYLHRVQDRLVGFSSAKTSGGIEFTKTLAGDTETLRIEPLAAGPLRVRVTFVSGAS